MNIIIGANTEARIFALFNPNWDIINHQDFYDQGISKFTGVSESVIDSIIYLEHNISNKKLLYKLGLNDSTLEDIPIKYSYDHDRLFLNRIDVDDSIILEKRMGVKAPINYGVKPVKICKQNTNKMTILKTPMSKVRKALNRKVRVNDISEIGELKTITKGLIKGSLKEMRFTNAISTISSKRLYKFIPAESPEFISFDTQLLWFESTRSLPKEIIYFCDEEYPFSRANINGHTIVFELDAKNESSIDQISDAVSKIEEVYDAQYQCHFEIPDSKIVPNQLFKLPHNIEPLGRFAQWNPEIKIEDIVKRATLQNPLPGIWQDQKNIVLGNIDIPPQTLKERQELTKTFILHIMDETNSLLNKINWEVDNEEKVLCYDSILEEWVDIFKYWMSIGVLWDIPMMDFLDKNEFKSAKAHTNIIRRRMNNG